MSDLGILAVIFVAGIVLLLVLGIFGDSWDRRDARRRNR